MEHRGFEFESSDWSPEQLWEDFDPAADDLQIKTLDTFERDGVLVRELTYVSHSCDDEPIVAYGFLAVPEGGEELPGVLHIHGGGQTASVDHVVHWAKRGYAALTFDWTGPRDDRERFSQFGGASDNKYLVEPDPYHSHLFHGTAIARRGLTLLEQVPEVDGERLGIYGISWGGFLSWLVNGSDSRVKAGVAIYGCGGTLKWGNGTGPDYDPDDEDQRTWNFCFNPFVYAELLHGPMLLLNSTNDFFGWMDTAEELYTILPPQHSLCFCPHFNHHLDEFTSRNLYAWIDKHLKGGAPWPGQVLVEVEPGQQLTIEIRPDRTDEIEHVELFHSVQQQPSPSRFWCPVPVEKNEKDWTSSIEPPLPELKHTIYATVHYSRGISVSSIPITLMPNEHGVNEDEAAYSLVIDDFSGGLGGWFLNGLGTEPFPELLKLATTEGPSGGPALTIEPVAVEGDEFNWNIATRKIGDPRWAAKGCESLLLLLKAVCTSPLSIRLTYRPDMNDTEAFTVEIDEPDQGWAELELNPKRFKGPGNEELESFDGFGLLEILSKSPVNEPPVVARVEWF